jgi:4-amino-4-deoxy-L-arabinose transferase-like glycosyltransferase
VSAEDRAPTIVRYYPIFACAVLALAAFNLVFRLDREVVTEWDESLYAITAWEMARGGHWVGTTFFGALDYYNTKPPLNVWLIALSFKAFGVSLWSLRLPAVASAFVTVVVLQAWVRRAIGAMVAIFSSLVLATCFGFLYAHSGRSANSDALLALLILLTAVTLWAARQRSWPLVWLGPILAGVFLLKGMAVLLPLAIVVVVRAWPTREVRARATWPLALAALIFAAGSGLWMFARWRLDQWRFLDRLFSYDFLGGTFRALEGHSGSPLFYLDVLQRDQFIWLLVGLVAVVMSPPVWRSVRSIRWRDQPALNVIVGAWLGLTLVVPSVMGTKNAWYLNPFYPAFALAIGWLVARAVAATTANSRTRLAAMAVVLATGVSAAEGRLFWYSLHHRDLSLGSQGTLLAQRTTLAGHTVFAKRWDNGDWFVLRALVRAEPREVSCIEDFLRDSQPGDFWYSTQRSRHRALQLVTVSGRHKLYRRVE